MEREREREGGRENVLEFSIRERGEMFVISLTICPVDVN